MRNKIYKFILNDGTELNNINTKHWPCYEYDGVLDRQKLESNISKITILRDNGIEYILKDKMLDQYMVTSNHTTRFNFKGKYDFFGVDECQKYTVKLANGTSLENVVIIKFPDYECNYIIEKDIFKNNLSKVIISKDNKDLYTLNKQILTRYVVKNGHTLFTLLDKNDRGIEEKEQKWKFILSDGTELNDIKTYFLDYDYEEIIEESVLKNKLSTVIMTDNYGHTSTYYNQILYDYSIMNGHTLFRLRDKGQWDIDNEIMARFYYKLIKGETPTINDVPSNFKAEVLKLMNQEKE